MSEKSKIALREEEILKFWRENKIFEKSLEKESPKGNFVFYDGPPFATGLPHYGSLLSSIIKDVIPRYKTMRGYRVRRRWGWDTHGLPIESLVEKKLGLKSKKDIEKIGIAKFNQEARNTVLQYAHDWEKYVERIGRWVEFKNAYKTMDNSYIESVWWALSELHKKDLLYEGRKVLMYCPHCETPLAKAEIAMDNSYKDVTEEAVTVKFKVKSGKLKDVYLIAWTTTPWTLPGNVALAVGKDIKYKTEEKDGENIIRAAEDGELLGKDLVGLEYEPLFDIPKIREIDKENRAYKVYAADFVNTEEGTGIVHTAVMYGEDDYQLGVKEGLPTVPLLDAGGKYNENAPEFLQGKYIKKAEAEIKDYLEKRGLLFERKNNTHSYPHCYRCGTPLIYNAVASWFINIQKIKEKLLKLNEKINWVPEHLKHGRFQNIVENAPDWTISRNRYWASPLPIWKNEKTGEVKVLGSLDELKKYTKKSGNKYFIMRHGEAKSNVLGISDREGDPENHVTENGKEEVKKAAESLKKVDLIIHSPFLRVRESVEILKEELKFSGGKIIEDNRLHEIGPGESDVNVRKRMGGFIFDIEQKYQNKNILVVSHGFPIWTLFEIASLEPMNQNKISCDLNTGGLKELSFIPFPKNENYELDLHRPYIDEVELVDEEGNKLKRIPEVVDCWVESGSMPFAEWHYPFSNHGKPSENKKEFESRFPGDFIAEYIAQTRTWFYYMHVLSVALFDSISFKNVVTTGNVMAHDGTKMSKSKGNYTDPLVNFDLLGADALRLYMMGSVVMQAEDMTFKDEDYKENYNRVINIFWNCFTFFQTYTDRNTDESKEVKSKNILDRWILSRLNTAIRDMTEAMEKYDMVHAARTIKPFVDDFSTWFIRRSRDRFKSDNSGDRKEVTQTTRFVLLEFSKIIAPIIPFISEKIYRELRSENDPESVHLCSWPHFASSSSRASRGDDEIIKNMEEVRRIVSLALEKRMAANIKVRQPLSKLKVKSEKLESKTEYLELIKDELNVKEVEFNENLEGEVELDTEITLELQKEGNTRDFIRAVQELRKTKNLRPQEGIELVVETNEIGKEFINSSQNQIRRPTNISKIAFIQNDGLGVQIGEMDFKISIISNVV